MIKIDGSFGEGGGQILRSSISLAAILGAKVHIENIRARRPRPGLAAQHLASARAAKKICGGELIGAKKGSTELILETGRPRAGHYSFELGTAGSTSLIFQTVLPILASADGESTVMIHGGTHNPMAPPTDFLIECFLPAAARMGMLAEIELIRYGFYPKGGGAIKARIKPWQEMEGPLDLTGEVDWGEPKVTVLITNLPHHVADREKMEAAKSLRIEPEEITVEALPGEMGPGNAVMIRYESQKRIALFTAFGEKGKQAERVAKEAARSAKNFARSKAPVDPNLADQLLLPMALAKGGRMLTSEITEHTRTQALLIKEFLGVIVNMEMIRPDGHIIEVEGANKAGQMPFDENGAGGIA